MASMVRRWQSRWVESRIPPHVQAVRDASQREMTEAARRAMEQLPAGRGRPSPHAIEESFRRTGAMPPSPNAVDQLSRRLRKAGVRSPLCAWRVDDEGGYFQVVVDNPTEELIATVRRAADVPQRVRVSGAAEIM
jgi:hypothetical protein